MLVRNGGEGKPAKRIKCAQQGALDSTALRLDGSFVHAVKLAVAAAKAYDAPKKVNARQVVQIGNLSLTAAGLKKTSPRSVHAMKKLFQLGKSQAEPEAVFSDPSVCVEKCIVASLSRRMLVG